MPDIEPRRSVLYVPAGNPRAVAKARALAADVLIFDLEDSVAPEGKATAREALRRALAERSSCEIVVRINGLDTEWATEDILAAIAVRADAILVPKVEGPGGLITVAQALADADAPATTEIWAMIETPKALLHLAAIAAVAETATAPLGALVVGTNDLSIATRVPLSADRAAYVPWFMTIVAAARAHGLTALDGPCNDFRDQHRFEAECRQARALGMDGKTLIHPDQIAAANRIFSPTAEERAAAEAVVSAFARPENRAKAVIANGGRMLERMHLAEAERILLLSASIEERQSA